MADLYDDVVLDTVQYVSLFLGGLVTVCLVPCVVVWIVREFCTIGVVELDT